MCLLGKQPEIVRYHICCVNVDLVTKIKVEEIVLHVIWLNEFKCSEIKLFSIQLK